MVEVKFLPDRWLADRFGRPVLCLAAPEPLITAEVLRKQVARSVARLPRPAFCYVKVPTSGVAHVRALTEQGWIVTETSLIFDRPPGGSWAPESIVIRKAKPEDREDVLEIAANSFLYSRFHLDDRVPNTTANEIKRAWVENYFRGARGEELLVGLMADRPVGFLAVLAEEMEGRPVRVIDLIAVAGSFQRASVGRSMVAHLCAVSSGRCELIRVGTQAANLPSINLYEDCGFKLRASQYVLHLHLE